MEMETIKLTDYTEWLILKALLYGYFLRYEVPKLITIDSGYYIYYSENIWHDNFLKRSGTYIERTPKDEIQLSMNAKIILLKSYVKKYFNFDDLQALVDEFNYTLREYDPAHEAEMQEIRERLKNRVPTTKLVQQAGKPKGYFVQVPIDYPHETAMINTI